MVRLCFGSFLTILMKCAAPTTTQKELCGRLLLAVNELFDIRGEDAVASKLANGYQNIPKDVSECAKTADPSHIASKIKDDVIPLFDGNRKKTIISAIKGILYDDDEIDENTVVQLVDRRTKEQVMRSEGMPLENLIAGILLYTLIYVKNAGMRDSILEINDSRILSWCSRFSDESISHSKVYSEHSKDSFNATPETPLQRMLSYLRKPELWDSSMSIVTDIRYYRYAPEFTIEHTYESEDGRDGYEYYLFSQRDPSPHWADIRLKYHQTVLYQTPGAQLDGARYFTPCPTWGNIRPNGEQDSVIYKYFIKDETDNIIQEFYYDKRDPEQRYAYDRLMENVLVFLNRDEKKRFEEYIRVNWYKRYIIAPEIRVPYIEYPDGKGKERYTLMCENVLRLKAMLRVFRDKQ